MLGPRGFEFFRDDPRHQAVARRIVRISMTPYDVAAGEGIASLEAIRNLPIAGRPETALHVRTNRAAKAAARGGTCV